MRRVVLLGPLSPGQTLEDELIAAGVEGPVALITAGWEEAERNDAVVDRLLGGGTRNLGLFGRRLDVLETDTAYAAAEDVLRADLAEAQAVYGIRIRHALAAVGELARRSSESRRSLGHETDEALAEVRRIDEEHVAAVTAAREAFETVHPPELHDVILAHRAQVADIVGECAAVAIAGGHVTVLLACLRLFDVLGATGDRLLLGWSAACIALSERIWIVDDADAAHRPAGVRDSGLGVVRGIVPVPYAAHRLQEDAGHRAFLARRLAPRICVLLDDGDRVEAPDGEVHVTGARVLLPDGEIRGAPEAA